MIYVRHIGERYFEYLIPWGKTMYQNGFNVKERKNHRKGTYSEKDTDLLVQNLIGIAKAFIDAHKRSVSFSE